MSTFKMTKQILWATLLILFPLGCTKDNTINSANTEPVKELIPLRLGNSWIFKITYYDSLGTNVFDYNDTLLITRDTLIENEKWYVCGKWNVGWPFLTNKSDGVYSRNPYSDDLIFKYPVALNSSYHFPGETRLLISTNDTVKTIAGDFICCRYRLGSPTMYADWYLSPGIGIVKSERVGTLASGHQFTLYRYVLLEIHLN